jgi:hypothetical protein
MDVVDPGFDRLRHELLDALRALGADLGARIHAVEAALGQRIDSVESALGQRIDSVERALGQRIDGVESALGQRIEQLGTHIYAVETGLANLSRYVDESDAAIRHRIDVVADVLRSDIAAVAQDLGLLNATTERFRTEVGEEFARVDRRLLDLHVRVSALERH